MWGRVITAMATPFNEYLEVDYQQAEKLARRLLEQGSEGLVVCGTTGEAPTLRLEEKLELFRRVKAAVGVKVPVIAGVGTNNTVAVVELSKKVVRCGVDGLLVVTPYYNKPNQEGLFRHFRTVAANVELPLMLYNVPGRTGVNMTAETVIRLAEIDNIVAVKEAAGDLDQLTAICRDTPEDFLIYSGEDGLLLPSLAVGAYGIVSVASHIVGKEMQQMFQCFLQGKQAEAGKLHQKLLPLIQALFKEANPIPLKAALNMIGLITGGLRLPLVEASAATKTLLAKELAKLDIAVKEEVER